MNDAQLHAPAIADIDDPGILVTGRLILFCGADLVDLRLGDDGSGRRVSRSRLGVHRRGIRTAAASKTFSTDFFIVFLLNIIGRPLGAESRLRQRKTLLCRYE